MNALLRFQLLQRILPGTQAYLFGIIHRVPPMTAFNALDQGFAVVSGGRLDGVNEVQAGLVQRHRVKGSQNADVLHLRVMGVGIAIAVNGQLVHHVDIQNPVPEVIGHRLSGGGHGLQKVVLRKPRRWTGS
mgnify:CR=1 FL=1